MEKKNQADGHARQTNASSSSTNRAENEEFYPEYVFETTKPSFFLATFPCFRGPDVRPTNQTAAAAAKWEDSNCGNPPKGFKYMWQIIKGGPKIPFINGAHISPPWAPKPTFLWYITWYLGGQHLIFPWVLGGSWYICYRVTIPVTQLHGHL